MLRYLNQFSHNKTPVTLVGKASTNSSHAFYSQFCRYMFMNVIESFHSVTLLSANDATDADPPPLTRTLLHQFAQLFTKTSFQATMNDVLRPFLCKFILVFWYIAFIGTPIWITLDNFWFNYSSTNFISNLPNVTLVFTQ